MGKVEMLEKEIEALPVNELRLLREWFIEFDSNSWNWQIEDDAASGKLDELAKKAIASHKRGDSPEI